MTKYFVLGVGRMGACIAADLASQATTDEVFVADSDPASVSRTVHDCSTAGAPKSKLSPRNATFDDLDELRETMAAADVTISAIPYEHNVSLTDLAVECGTHLVDLGGNPEVVARQHERHEAALEADVAIVPDCGLAPGMANVLAGHLVRSLAHVRSVYIRVGGLPQHPKGPFGYALVFSAHGLINEYKEPADAIRDGEHMCIQSLDDIEPIFFDGFRPLEAFNTAGGTGTMCDTFAGRLHDLDYKTIRYRGHATNIRLLFDLGVFDDVEVVPGLTRRDVNEAALVERLSLPGPDVVLMRLTAKHAGREPHWNTETRYEMVDRHDGTWTAMQRSTGFPTSITAQMLAAGEISARGVLHNEVDVPWLPMAEGLAARGVELRVDEVP